MSSSGPRVLAADGRFRIVRIEDGEQVKNVLEKADGCDALGVERWREVSVGQAETITRYLRDWVIAHALQCPHMKE